MSCFTLIEQVVMGAGYHNLVEQLFLTMLLLLQIKRSQMLMDCILFREHQPLTTALSGVIPQLINLIRFINILDILR